MNPTRLACSLMLALCASCFSVGAHDTQCVPFDERLPWMHPGSTGRDEVVDRLGQPGWTFEGGRIQTWSLAADLAVEHPGPPFQSRYAPFYSLVVVFGDDQRVARASLVRL